MTTAERPVDGATFARLMAPFDPFETRPEIAVAVSGGRDSVCLALLAHEWVRGRHGKLIALIVDHGLRPQSAKEASETARTMRAQGAESVVLRWTEAKRTTGLQEAAREARYRLLGEACRERGILHLLVAHHADDQTETIAMRAARGSGPDGLAGMAALVETPDVRLLRPLLPVPRERLTATLIQRGVAWIDDPSNLDQRFERARLRRVGVAAVRPDDSRAGEEERLAGEALDVLELDEGVALDRNAFIRLRVGLRRRLLSRVVQGVGGGDHPPRRDRLERALERMADPADRGKSGRGADFTLSGCQFVLRQAGDGRRLLWIVRPESGRKGRQPLIPAAFFACDPAAATHLGK
ncbi:MAG: tRNA lysidine(34) synthetase TilS [Reyranella sp.]|nr:MAG: tRNA lysidine(34) synthetase TilS [Reyranella sp.]